MTHNAAPSRRDLGRVIGPWSKQRILVVLIAITGVGILLYPTAAAWFSDRVHATEISGYVATVENLNPSEKTSILDSARKFNEELPSGPLRDPYSLNEEGKQTTIGAGSDAYQNLLDVGPGGMMGRISIPSIHTDLPIFHGTDEDSLSKGAGHLFGSALPVGGQGTHGVLSAHSGFVNATLFEDLDKVAEGDTFSISVLDQTIYYKVDSIQTVLPNQTDALRKVPDKDYVTLVTCTPTGVNSHRLLVRGERTEAPSAESPQTMPSRASDPGFPWWVLGLIGAATVAILITRPQETPQGIGATQPPATIHA
ncbi:sortase A [Pseudarthrobacter sp. PvP004]|jgi:sortase A|uniref:Sortase family protein n=1 Tax=Paenarthrobacter aurescens (strain TC1) TaxID=290340 RepID=A1R5Z6_PAEAT|nr:MULTISPECIES: class C sortase [Micrococcaceae]ABM06421.1 putative sortase family protein [Paenarthrobacter aurescens TC1]MBP2266004.1 sortase A [Pseudarthrobacter sp. PvP004]